jgi:hypothetical protein
MPLCVSEWHVPEASRFLMLAISYLPPLGFRVSTCLTCTFSFGDLAASRVERVPVFHVSA